MHYFDRTKISAILKLDPVNLPGEVIVLGWLRTRRDMKTFSFLEVNDGSCLDNLQAVVEHVEGLAVEELRTGAAVMLRGPLTPLEGRKQKVEMRPVEVRIVGTCTEDFPMQKKRHSFEYLRDVAHLRPRTNAFGVMNRFRSRMSHACHRYFQDRGFYWLSSPLITTSDCEGAGEMFQVTTLDINKPARTEDGAVDYSQDFFAEAANLTVSGQLEGETMALALGDIYTFGPAFRAENSNTVRHLSELWMIEPEMAFCELADNVNVAVDFLKTIFRYGLEECPEEMEFFDERVEKGIRASLEAIVNAEFAVITYTEAVDILAKAVAQGKATFEYPCHWGAEIHTEHERFLAENHFKRPVVVTDYPKSFKAFYMRLNDDEKTVGAMDILVPKVGELIGGSQREERLDVLQRMIIEKKVPAEKIDWYLDLRRYGSVPHSGFGVGFERLLMYMSGMQNIRDVIPYPRTPRNAKF